VRINVAVPEAHVDAPVLDAALESVTRLNESMMASGVLPSFQQALHRGIKWRPEPPGAEHFDHGATVLQRGWGDCDDLAPYEAASIRHAGEDPGARAIVQRSGPKSWHAVVQMSDGSIRDPSKRAGMRAGVPHGVRGATLPLMYPAPSGVHGAYIVRPQIAVRPVRGAFQARADMPWYWREHLEDKPSATDIALTALHTAPVAHTALTGAIDGAIELAEANGHSTDHDITRMRCLADAIEGAYPEELAEVYGEELAEEMQQVVGSFFSHLNPMKAIRSVTNLALHNPLTSMAANFIPGGHLALDAARGLEHLIPGGGHGAGPGVPAGVYPAPAFPGVPGAAAFEGAPHPTKSRGTYRIVFD
jgi:hypothetical protein